MTFLLIFMIFVGNRFTRKKITSECFKGTTTPTPVDTTLEILSMVLSLCTYFGSLMACHIFWISRNYFKKINKETAFHRLSYFSLFLHYLFPAILYFLGFSVWLVFMCLPYVPCENLDVMTGAITVVYLCILYTCVYDMQVVDFIGQFVANFYDILSHFSGFLLIYLLVTLVFGRVFQIAYNNFSETTNLNGSELSKVGHETLFADYFQSVYTLSLIHI